MTSEAINSNIFSNPIDRGKATQKMQSTIGISNIFAGMTKAQAESAGILDLFTKIDGIIDNKKDDVISEDEISSYSAKQENVYVKIKKITDKYNIDINELKNNNILEQITGLSLNELDSLNQKEFEDKIKILDGAMKRAKLSGDMSAQSIINEGKAINICITHGKWDTDDIDKWLTKGESIADRITRTAEKDYKSLSDEEKEAEIKKYMDTYLTSDKLEIQDFTKLLMNTKGEDRKLLIIGLKYLSEKNQIPGLDAILQEYGSEFADENGYELSEAMSSENKQNGMILITQTQSVEGVRKTQEQYHNEQDKFEKENIDIISRIKKKKENNEELTEEENIIYQKLRDYEAVTIGQAIGVDQSTNKIDDEKYKLLIKIIKDALTLSTGNNVTNVLNNYVTNNPTSEKSNSLLKQCLNNTEDTTIEETASSYSETYNKSNNNNNLYLQTQAEKQNEEFTNTVTDTFKQDDESSIIKQNEIINKTFSDLKEKNTTPERQRVSMSKGIQLLNTLIKENKIQGSIHEAKIINKLKSLPVQTLVTLMCSLNSDAQNYFVSKNIITERELMLSMNKADQRNLSDKIQDKLKEIREEATGQKLNIDYA